MSRYYLTVSAPRFAIPIYDGIIRALAPNTRRVVKLFDLNRSEWQAHLLNVFDADQLPLNLGGNI